MRLLNNLYAGAVALAAQEASTKEAILKMDAQTDATLTWNAVATAVCDDADEPVNGLKGNDFVITNGATYALVRNTGGIADGTATFHTQQTVKDPVNSTDKEVANEIVTIVDDTVELIGPFRNAIYGTSSSDTTVYVSFIESVPGDLEIALVYGI